MIFNQIATTLKNLKPAATIITPSNHGCGLTNNIIKFVAEEWNITPIPVLVYDVLTIKEIFIIIIMRIILIIIIEGYIIIEK